MYLLRQAYEESIHTWAYQYIVESLGMDEGRIFNMYREVESIYDKADFVLTFNEGIFDGSFKTGDFESDQKFLENWCVFSLILEGIFFYSAFAVVLGFKRQNKLTGSAEQIEYIMRDGITHGLDMHTDAKADFLDAFNENILKPRDMDYVLQFTGPTGANAVEAALKLARKVTGRSNVISFTNGFHGVTLGALAATGNQHHRGAAGVSMPGTTPMPYDGYLGKDVDSTEYLDRVLGDPSSGVDMPAAIIVECVQGEGGLTAARMDWLKNLEKVCRKHNALMIVDDIQAGCGRTGTFFSFEPAGIKPDIVTLSKSLSGFGLPFAVTLIDRDLDAWDPGEHNGTFRGNNHAFVTATVALEKFWKDDAFAKSVQEKGDMLLDGFKKLQEKYAAHVVEVRGRGMMRGIVVESGDLAGRLARRANDAQAASGGWQAAPVPRRFGQRSRLGAAVVACG